MGLYAESIEFPGRCDVPVTAAAESGRRAARRARTTGGRPGGSGADVRTSAWVRGRGRAAGAPQSGRMTCWRGSCDEKGVARRRRARSSLRSLMAAWLAPNATEFGGRQRRDAHHQFHQPHTNEAGSFTYMVNGVYDQAVLDKLNWFMRDWRLNEPTKMDPKLFDIIWEVYRESGSHAADRRALRLSLAADQRDAAAPLAPGRRAFPAHARQGDRRPFHRCRPRHAFATSRCGCRRAASASIRPASRPGCISTAGRCATGRA